MQLEMSQKLILAACCVALLFIYVSMTSYPTVNVIQAMVGPLDIFLALAVPVGFCKSTVWYVKGKHFTVKGAFFSLGYLLIFILSQLIHSGVERTAVDAFTMAEQPPIEETIERLVDRALLDSNVDARSQAAAMLYMISGIKTMYKSKDHTYVVYSPSKEEQEEKGKWENTNTQVEAMKQQLRHQTHALINRSMFHISSFFVLYSITLFLEVRKARKQK